MTNLVPGNVESVQVRKISQILQVTDEVVAKMKNNFTDNGQCLLYMYCKIEFNLLLCTW